MRETTIRGLMLRADSGGFMEFYAHSAEGKPPDKWHGLEKHLKGTAELAASFAAAFGCGDWAYLAGLWHDLRHTIL